MTDLEILLPRVMRYARNAPEPLIVSLLVDALRTICERTASWREDVTIAVSEPGDIDLAAALDPDWSAEVHAVETAALDGHDLEPVDVAWLDDHRPGWDRNADIGAGRYYTQLAPDTLRLVPSATGSLALRIALKPALAAATIPDALYWKYGVLAAKGAAGEILGLPGTEYANPALGGVLRSEFQAALPSAARAARKGQQHAPLRTKASFL